MSNKDSDSNEGSGNDDDQEDEVVAEPLATTRSRRANAGNRMSKMIQEEEDDYYSSHYWAEEDDDMDFDDEEEANDDDVEEDYDVDSDFSIDEADEIAPEHQEVEEETRRRRGVYREPRPRGPPTTQPDTAGESSSTPIQNRTRPGSSVTPHSPSKNRGERSFRDSTRKKTEETIKNFQTGKVRRKKSRNLEAMRPLTQEEMLEEAKITEEENIKSLEIYQKLESEKLKKIKQVKKTLPLPYVTYLSTTMPILNSDKRYTRNFMTYVT